jgi:xylulose-5-phosphate/fructose-6-phosphate phosphoketolase
MIVLRTPKGWTGPKTFEGKKVEGTFRAHQVPITDGPRAPRAAQGVERLAALLQAGELFDERGTLGPRAAESSPPEVRAALWARAALWNGGRLLVDLALPARRSPTR